MAKRGAKDKRFKVKKIRFSKSARDAARWLGGFAFDDFREEDHPRGPDGKFKGKGGGGIPKSESKEKTESKTVGQPGGGSAGNKPAKDPSKATGRGAAMQKKYGGTANHDGVGNGSKGHKPSLKNGTGVTKVPHDMPPEECSFSKNVDSNGKMTPEREKLHDDVVMKHFEGVEKAEGQPTYYMMGGGPAAGKSSVIRSGQVEVPDKFNSVHINSDEIKGEIPEYRSMVDQGNKGAAGYAHEESSALAKRVQTTALENGYNTLLDGTGDNSVESVMKKIEEARKSGARVEGYYVTCPTEVAVERNRKRAEGEREKGRLVPEHIVKDTHRNVSKILPQVARHFDKVELYDTSSDGPPVLIAKGGGGQDLQIINKAKYEAFLKKGDETD